MPVSPVGPLYTATLAHEALTTSVFTDDEKLAVTDVYAKEELSALLAMPNGK